MALLNYIRYRMWTWFMLQVHDEAATGLYWSSHNRREDNPWRVWYEYTEGTKAQPRGFWWGLTFGLVPLWFVWSALRSLALGQRVLNSEESWRAEVFLSNMLVRHPKRLPPQHAAESDLANITVDKVLLGWHRLDTTHTNRRRLYVAVVRLLIWSKADDAPTPYTLLLSSASPRTYREVRSWLRREVTLEPVVSLYLGGQ